MVLAVPLSSVSFVLVLHAHLGLGPWHVLQQGIGRHAGVSIGVAGWIMNLFVAGFAALVRERCRVGTLAVILAIGFGIDRFDPLISTPGAAVPRAAFLLAGTAGMALAGALIISARVGVAPLDALMTGLDRCSPLQIPISAVRVGMEAFGLGLGLLAGGEAGVGSLVIGLGIGPAIHAWLHLLDAVPDRPVGVAAA